TPGNDSSRETTLSLLRASSFSAALRTSERDVWEYFSLFLTSARVARAAAAFAKASARCWGVNGGRGTSVTSSASGYVGRTLAVRRSQGNASHEVSTALTSDRSASAAASSPSGPAASTPRELLATT